MLKKLTSLLLSLLLCLPLMPGQARAADEPDPVGFPVMEEPLNPETPEEPEAPVMPLGAEGAGDVVTDKDHSRQP